MAYNAFFATEFFDQMESKPWVMMSNVYTQLLIGPEHLQPKVLPVELKKQAIDLMLEDLHTKNVDIRVTAKKLGCEDELEELKLNLIEYLYSLKK